MAVTNIPNVQNWTVTPQNGQSGYFDLMNTWLGQSTLVIASLQSAITAQNAANSEINTLASQAENNAIIATGLANYQGEHSTLTTYSKSQSVSVAGLYYTSKVDGNSNHAVTDTNYWVANPINDKVSYADSGVFNKPNKGALFIKVSPSSIKLPTNFTLTIGSIRVKLATEYTLSLNSDLIGSTKTAGTDYYVYAKSDMTFYLSASDAITTDKLIGGFHYGLVGETELLTGNKTEADMVKIRGINEYSFWDLKFRPISSPKGMVNIGKKWYDIYLLNSEHITNGTSKAGVTIAAGTTEYGRAIPKIPLEFGGNNTLTYGKFTWFQACEIAKAASKQLLNYSEFPTIAYGVTEQVSSLTNTYETVMGKIEHYPNLTSKYGIEQATGTQWIWGNDLANGYGTTDFAWKTGLTNSRGDIYSTSNSPVAVLLGGYRDVGVSAGSRASFWNSYVWGSGWDIGCRFACNHLELV